MVIFLPGYSLKNKEEEVNISSSLIAAGFSVYQHEWSHWQNPETEWSPQNEISKIEQNLEAENIIISKSIGTLIASMLLEKDLSKYKAVILMGIPLNDLEENEKAHYYILKTLNIPIFVIHNREDTHGAWLDVEPFLLGTEYELTLKESSDHSYNYPDDVLGILKSM